VLEGAVNVQAPTGETETGLVLLPFSGHKFTDAGKYVPASAVQIFTFSSTTLTRRGLMEHPDGVRRTIRLPNSDDGANISDTVLTTYDQSDVDKPTKLGQLDLAPEYTHVFAFGNHRVRVRTPEAYSYWGDPNVQSKAEVVPAGASMDVAAPVASIEVPRHASLYKVGNLLVSLQQKYANYPTLLTTIKVFDFTDPLHPEAKGQLVTTALQANSAIDVANNSLVFRTSKLVENDLGLYSACNAYGPGYVSCQGKEGCKYLSGGRECRTPAGGQQYCWGGFAQCTDHLNAESTCVPLDWSVAQQQVKMNCWQGLGKRHTTRFDFRVVDVSNPASPSVVQMPLSFDEAVNARTDGMHLYVTVKQPHVVPGDGRPHAKYYVRRVDMTKPSAFKVGPAVNVPGEVLDIQGNKLFTMARAWGKRWIDPAVAKVELQYNGTAAMLNYQKLTDRSIMSLVIDEHQVPVITHKSEFGLHSYKYPKIQLLKPKTGSGVQGFETKSQMNLDAWMSVFGVEKHRLLVSVPSGTLFVDIDDPALPTAQVFIPGWQSRPVIDADEILVANGRYGIDQLGLEETNLLYTGQ
jgi:hypothetical protein